MREGETKSAMSCIFFLNKSSQGRVLICMPLVNIPATSSRVILKEQNDSASNVQLSLDCPPKFSHKNPRIHHMVAWVGCILSMFASRSPMTRKTRGFQKHIVCYHIRTREIHI